LPILLTRQIAEETTMRWHIRGTDATTDEPVELTIHESDAQRAICAAMNRQIVVTHIRRRYDARYKWFTALALCFVVGVIGTWTYVQKSDLRRKLDEAILEQNRMAETVAQAERTVESLRAGGTLESNAATQAAQLASELALARSRMSLTEQQLASERRRMTDLEKAAKMAGDLDIQARTLRAQLASSTQEVANLKTALALQTRRIEELQKPLPDKNLERVAELQKAHAAQANEIAELKKELLLLVAQTSTNPAPNGVDPPQNSTHPKPPPESKPAPQNRWSLAINFDKAHDFMVLHTDPGSLAVTLPVATRSTTGGSAPAGDLITSGAWATHAVRMRIAHDQSKEKVHSATLEVSLAADAPAEILAENKALIGEFVKTFAGDVKEPGAVAGAAAQLVGLDASRHIVFRGEDTMVTLWNDKTGVYTVRVESKHQE
jgi:hypothetical protein